MSFPQGNQPTLGPTLLRPQFHSSKQGVSPSQAILATLVNNSRTHRMTYSLCRFCAWQPRVELHMQLAHLHFRQGAWAIGTAPICDELIEKLRSALAHFWRFLQCPFTGVCIWTGLAKNLGCSIHHSNTDRDGVQRPSSSRTQSELSWRS